jgi:HPt (histidine-containing phosphotransfer) domain-containing protein
MADMTIPLVDWSVFTLTRTQLGGSFIRILGYFVEDGEKSIKAIEDATRKGDAAAIVRPAHTLKSEARQFGGERLGQLAEDIEIYARDCVERHESPADYVDRVVLLRPMYQQMLGEIEAAVNPLVQRKPAAFGRRMG